MTRNRAYALTAVSAGLYVLLCWIFADKLFTGPVNTHYYAESSLVAWALLAVIIIAGIYQAQRIPAEGIVIEPETDTTTPGQTEDPKGWKLLMGNVFFALIWLPVRFFVGHEWLTAGEHKIRDGAWMDGGTALQGYLTGRTTIPEGAATSPAGKYPWFHDFLKYMLDNEWYTWFAKVIAVGEFMVGLGLIVGALVGIAAFFGTVMNFNFQLAGTASSNPVLFGLGVLLVIAWKVAGWWGLDRVLLPALGTPWKLGKLFRNEAKDYPTDSPRGAALA
jgi:thiosulfate dehydrogenase [quinone] large subunit